MRRLFMILSKEGISTDKFQSLKKELGEGDFWVITANPKIKNEFTFNVIVPEEYEVPIRVGFSINKFLNYINIETYDWLIKIDSDMKIPSGFFDNMPDVGVYGCGSLMAISKKFFKKYLKGKYPINNSDDGYILALAEAKRELKYIGVKGPYAKSKIRRFNYGVEKYKYGFPLWLQIIRLKQENISDWVHEMAGWFYGFINQEKYEFSTEYKIATFKRIYNKIIKFII